MIRVLMVDDEPLVRRGIVAGVDWAALGCEVVGEAQSSRSPSRASPAQSPNTCGNPRRALRPDSASPATRDPETGIYPSYSACLGECATSCVPVSCPAWDR